MEAQADPEALEAVVARAAVAARVEGAVPEAAEAGRRRRFGRGRLAGGGSSSIPQVQHFAIVVLENSNYGDIVGSPNAPYINSLIAQGGLAGNYYANIHPSIGNYFVMTTGVAYSIDDNFSGVVPIDNVVRELTAASKSWKVYAQSLPSQGYLGGDVYPYLRRHNPISYFSDVQPPSQSEHEHC